ncbi:hypothetical protein KM043_013383 [Ampulex compressa]|nr:hypothetical protein KM043_013383 [Ampulex compressa]
METGLPKTLSPFSSRSFFLLLLDFQDVLKSVRSGSGVANGDGLVEKFGDGAVGSAESAVPCAELAPSLREPLRMESGEALGNSSVWCWKELLAFE